MRFFCHAALIVMLSAPVAVFAQESTPSEANDPLTLKMHEDVVVSGSYEPLYDSKVADKKFWLVSAALNTTMLLDTWSTFDVMGRCPTCREANPYVAPFVKKGPAATFTAGQAFDIGVMALSAKMKASRKPQIRNIWWVVPVALTTGHALAFHHNQQLAR